MCEIVSCDATRAGSPCTDHSSYGSMKKFKGGKAKYFYTWVALRRNLKDSACVRVGLAITMSAGFLSLMFQVAMLFAQSHSVSFPSSYLCHLSPT
eukprot:10263087-Alexandrium_andersonii.AAC.1